MVNMVEAVADSFVHRCTACAVVVSSYRKGGVWCSSCGAPTMLVTRGHVPVVEIVGCSSPTPPGICDTCSGDGEVCGADGVVIMRCPDCEGTGSSVETQAEALGDTKELWAELLNYPAGYIGPPDPHVAVVKLDDDTGLVACVDCGHIGPMNETLGGAGCGKFNGNCDACGCGPLCERGCPGVAALLANPQDLIIHIEETLQWLGPK